ncbi:DNA-binding protein, partial [Salmonella enterica]|nr:DNA-binding protein [Salmonella enterica]
MRPATFEPEEIIAAGKALQEEGVVNITGFALRKRVGGGDPSRLRQVWDGYLAGQTSVEPEPLADLPPELADAVKAVTATLTGHVVQLLRELNDRAVRAAECRVDDITRTAEEQKAQAERELADAVQAVDDLEQKLDAVTTDLRKTLELLDGSREREQTYLVELAQVRERLAATEERLKDAEKSGREAAEQHRQQTETLQHKLDDAEQRLSDSV